MNEEKQIKLKFLFISITFLVIGAALLFYGLNSSQKNIPEVIDVAGTKIIEASPSANQLVQLSPEVKEEAVVKRVVDGDTIELESGEKVRYIGIDTPETVDPRRAVGCFGKEASDENKKLVDGKNIILAKDVSETDKFGRLLRLVYLPQENGNSIFVNDYLVRQGYAKASTFPPDVKYATQFVEAEKEARENQRGLWKKCL